MRDQRAGVDLVLTNGRIWTGCEDLAGQPREVTALAVRGERVVAAGTEADLAPMEPGARQVVDLGGRRVLPGLIDSHIHAVRAGLTWHRTLHWERLRTLEECLAAVRDAAASSAPGSWITVVGGWHADQLAEGRPPRRSELDEAAPHHPVFVQELYERAVLSSAALAACGWHDETPDPDGGRLERDREGRLTGEVLGMGGFAVPLALALPDERRADDGGAEEGTRAMLEDFARLGLTGVHDGFGLMMTPDDYRPLVTLWRSGRLPLRVRLFLSVWERGREVDNIRAITQLAHPGFGDPMLKTSGVGEVAHLGCHDFEGLAPFPISEASSRELLEISRACAAAGWPMAVHAVRDETLSHVLDAWEAVQAETGRPRELRWSIVHADQASPTNLDRIAELGLGVLVQNRAMLATDRYVEAWGDAAVRRFPPIGEMLERGIRIGAGTDATRANWYSPWASIWWLVTGESVSPAPARDEEHRLTVAQAIAAYTRDAAWFTFEEHERGRLASGYLADLCIPTEDPFYCPVGNLRELESDLTVVGGRLVHGSPELAHAWEQGRRTAAT